MSNNYSSIIENYTAKDILKSNLTFAAYFIATYEAVKNGICDSVRNFYCIENVHFEDGEICSKATQQYKEEILNIKPDGKKCNCFFASLLWLKNSGAINDEDYYDITVTLKEKRNSYAHHLFEQLGKPTQKEDYVLLKKLIHIQKKINVWWATHIEDLPKESVCLFDEYLEMTYEALFGEKQ